VFANYEDRLANGQVDIRELVVGNRITREPRDYQKAGVTAIAAQQLFGSGVKLRPGQNIEYVITNSEAHVPNDRVQAFALWERWFGYDLKNRLSFALQSPRKHFFSTTPFPRVT
jgi:DNA polymerase elongation subunit (family B)